MKALAITFIIVVGLIFLIRYLFKHDFLISEKSTLEYLIENEQRSLSAARLLRRKTTRPLLKKLADEYITRQEESIARLEKLIGTI